MAQAALRTDAEFKTRTISSNEAKQHWGSMMTAASNGEAVIVESHGRPKAVVISPEAFVELQEAREKQRRAEALEGLKALQQRQAERNSDLSEEEVEEIAIRVGREINAAVTKKWRKSVEAERSQ